MISLAPSLISSPLVCAGLAMCGWMLWRQYRSVLHDPQPLRMVYWLALLAGFVVLVLMSL